jgi:hypothetical protein
MPLVLPPAAATIRDGGWAGPWVGAQVAPAALRSCLPPRQAVAGPAKLMLTG